MKAAALLLTAALAAVQPAGAQEKLQPPARDALAPDTSAVREEPLPRIDLPEFQITGKERIALPEFSKDAAEEGSGLDPLLGPRGPGTRDAPVIDFGGGVKEGLGADTVPEGLSGRVTAGYGSFDTPWFEGWFGSATGATDFLMKAGYVSSGGHRPHAGFRKGHGEFRVGWSLPDDASFLPGSRLDAAVGLHGDGYRLYGSRVPDRRRTVTRFRTDLSLQSAVPDFFGYTAAVHVQAVGVTDSIRARSTSVGLDLSAERELGDVMLRGTAGFWIDAYETPSSPADPVLAHLGAAARVRLREDLDAEAGIALHRFRGSDGEGRTRLAPRLGVSWYPASGLTLFARFESSVLRNGLGGLVERNPYIVSDPRIRHEERPVVLSAGAEVDMAGEVRATAVLEYTRARSLPLFLDGERGGVWTPEYAGVTRTLGLRSVVRAGFGDGHTASVSLVFQGARNSFLDAAPPYVPSAAVAATYGYRFPFGLTAGGSLQVVGERPAGDGRVVPGFALLDLTTSITVAGGLTLTGTVTNLLNPSCAWWEGYGAPPRGVGVSLSHSW